MNVVHRAWYKLHPAMPDSAWRSVCGFPVSVEECGEQITCPGCLEMESA